jgi:hypothetical protein
MELLPAKTDAVSNRTWTTRDVSTAIILLYANYELLRIDVNERKRADFVFSFDDSLKAVIARFNSCQLRVEPHKFAEIGFNLRESLIADWERGGFKLRNDRQPRPFESLEVVVTVATLMGFTSVNDPRRRNSTNPFGIVPLRDWRGVDTGVTYEYAFDGTTIEARPAVIASRHGLDNKPKTPEEFAELVRKTDELRKRLGPNFQFLLGKRDR